MKSNPEQWLIAIKEDNGPSEDNEVAVHVAHCPAGMAATLCGLDGGVDDDEDDYDFSGQIPVELPKNPKITCEMCLKIIAVSRIVPRRFIPKEYLDKEFASSLIFGNKED